MTHCSISNIHSSCTACSIVLKCMAQLHMDVPGPVQYPIGRPVMKCLEVVGAVINFTDRRGNCQSSQMPRSLGVCQSYQSHGFETSLHNMPHFTETSGGTRGKPEYLHTRRYIRQAGANSIFQKYVQDSNASSYVVVEIISLGICMFLPIFFRVAADDDDGLSANNEISNNRVYTGRWLTTTTHNKTQTTVLFLIMA